MIAAAHFETKKAQGAALLPRTQLVFDTGPSRFMNKGTNGWWQGVFLSDDPALYDALVDANFAPDLALWVANGRLGCPMAANIAGCHRASRA